ncbi:probable Golgi apyrase [Zygosaccharomyces bailii]|nr:probable Golgi apyrase [Zygosaccharomyces bailii]
MVEPNSDQYGIVVDAGSSGSRAHIFKWGNPDAVLRDTGASDYEHTLHSVPKIYQEDGWTLKITPGLSEYEDKPNDAFTKHIKPLLESAQKIIPAEKVKSTPVFIQATAGMRMLPEKKRAKILENLCKNIRHSTNYLLQNCDSQIQVIDGETEGLYGWLGLNYLFGHFNDYDNVKTDHFTFGFMDMGGASTQIAFSPTTPGEVEKHRDDITTVYLKSINGEIQKWDVFVSTWLGFGANEARKRYLAQLINSLPENANSREDDDFQTRQLTDPCMPKNCKTKFEFKDKDFNILGTGNYEQCVKSIYPLLLKHLPCKEEPCLFNGVHAPQIDFYNDKFLGTSEYWYTANDVFKLGGAYNFEKFSTKVKEFCNSNWSDIKANGEKGAYNNIPVKYLADSCFKASWVLNVLHEGFGLPRAGVDQIDDIGQHPLFQSAEKVNERELSWTLGRILLYASGSIKAGSADSKVGILLSSHAASLQGKNFLSGALEGVVSRRHPIISTFKFFLLLLISSAVWFFFIKKGTIFELKNTVKGVYVKIKYSRLRTDIQSQLEEGTLRQNRSNNEESSYPLDDRDGFKFRSKSMFNLNDEARQSGARQSVHHPPNFVGQPTFQASTPSPPPQMPRSLRPAFSLADFSKFKDSKLND